MSDKDLKLNSLSRYSKRSSRLILEEYSHCEVPAGCGGVVLRWRNPDEPIPMKLDYFWLNGKDRAMQLDGKHSLHRSKIPITYGKHALNYEFTEIDPHYACILVTGELDAEFVNFLQPEGEIKIISKPDGTWKYTLEPQANEDWKLPEFDDSTWLPLVEKPMNTQPRFKNDNVLEWAKKFLDKGAVPIGIDTQNTSILTKIQQLLGQSLPVQLVPHLYIRKTFTVLKKTAKE